MAEGIRSELIPEGGTGATRAAALLVGLGADVAGRVFRLLGEAEVRKIAAGAKSLRKAHGNTIQEALKVFSDAMSGAGGEAAAGDELLRGVAEAALGADVARRAFNGMLPPTPPDEVLGPISQADPEALAMVLSREQAQTVALVLSSIDTQRAVAVLEKMPEALRPDVVRRMATIESVSPDVLREVGQALSAELRAVVAGGMRKVDGKVAALEILRRSPGAQQSEVVAEIEKDDPALAADLRTRLFTFDDLASLGDRDVQTLLKDIDLGRLTVALKGASGAIKEKFLKNMSSRAAAMLSDDLTAMAPVKLSVVEAAQGEIAKAALTLAENDKITIVRATDKMV